MGDLKMSGNAVGSVAAVLADGPGPHKRTEGEKAYDEVVDGVRLKPDGHVQKPEPPEGPLGRPRIVRLYSVTTLASSERYGGKRTVAVCTSFERAKQMVEENEGDIFELSYCLAVIEGIAADCLYGGTPWALENEQYWYVWKGDQDGSYRAIEVPAAYENCINIGIG